MVRLVLVDVVIIVLGSVAIGGVAPRIPATWLTSDVGPLVLRSRESARGYTRIGTRTLARRLPELGTVFGGESKSHLPGYSNEDLRAYTVELRRAEWVHWSSMLVPLVLFAFNPPALALLFLALVVAGNLPFVLILRNNRLRIRDILERRGPDE